MDVLDVLEVILAKFGIPGGFLVVMYYMLQSTTRIQDKLLTVIQETNGKLSNSLETLGGHIKESSDAISKIHAGQEKLDAQIAVLTGSQEKHHDAVLSRFNTITKEVRTLPTILEKVHNTMQQTNDTLTEKLDLINDIIGGLSKNMSEALAILRSGEQIDEKRQDLLLRRLDTIETLLNQNLTIIKGLGNVTKTAKPSEDPGKTTGD